MQKNKEQLYDIFLNQNVLVEVDYGKEIIQNFTLELEDDNEITV